MNRFGGPPGGHPPLPPAFATLYLPGHAELLSHGHPGPGATRSTGWRLARGRRADGGDYTACPARGTLIPAGPAATS
jgi:hypothetical protein